MDTVLILYPVKSMDTVSSKGYGYCIDTVSSKGYGYCIDSVSSKGYGYCIDTVSSKGYGYCLRNRPNWNYLESEVKKISRFAGEFFDENAQCELVFGKVYFIFFHIFI